MLQPGRRRLRCPQVVVIDPLVPLVLGVALVMIATLFTSQAAIAATPSVRLLVASTELTAERNKRDVVFVDPGAYITPVGEDFERS
jgi:multisubunit Na+/H+ antiporter MnhB subunit